MWLRRLVPACQGNRLEETSSCWKLTLHNLPLCRSNNFALSPRSCLLCLQDASAFHPSGCENVCQSVCITAGEPQTCTSHCVSRLCRALEVILSTPNPPFSCVFTLLLKSLHRVHLGTQLHAKVLASCLYSIALYIHRKETLQDSACVN